MAVLYPNVEDIKMLRPAPTEGEWRLVQFLDQHLDDSYEIFFQPCLNGDNPDVIVMRKGSGVLIIEVKDWLLQSYYIDDKNRWKLREKNAPIKSPLEQVLEYKENLFDLHIESLLDKKISDPRYFGIVSCAVYFHRASEDELRKFLFSGPDSSKPKYERFIERFHLLGYDSLNVERLRKLIRQCHLDRSSVLFTSDLYESFKRYLLPPVHRADQGKEPTLTREQEVLTISRGGARQKIKGVAGSGKSFVLARRAVNAHKRTGEPVLILTFNLTLKNYLHDQISLVRENFDWKYFHITNYHQFFKFMANNHNLEIVQLSDYDNPRFFEAVRDETKRYRAVFIDEGQDYKTEWYEVITHYFLAPDAEFVVFGDEKQNIYGRPLDENREPVVKSVPGRWNRSLNAPIRLQGEIVNLAEQFQTCFFREKYALDEFTAPQLSLDFQPVLIQYHHFVDPSPGKVFARMYEIIRTRTIHPSDVAIVSPRVEVLREIDYRFRHELHEKTTTTFETREQYEQLSRKIGEQAEKLQEELEKIRRNRKNHFWMGTGTVKLSTIHSFKGWEAPSLFLIIEDENDTEHEFATDELIYTGLTRARLNLFIFNLGNSRYDGFFRQHVKECYTV